MIDRLCGKILHQTYRIERKLGEGAVGSVYEAAHLRLPRRYAIKFLLSRQLTRPAVVARFEREAKVLCELRHRNIVEVVDYNATPEGIPYIVMELLAGETLRDKLQRDGRFDLPLVTEMLQQIGSALQAAHDRGVVHRDLKPANIFLSAEEDAALLLKVLDFGVSKVISDEQLTAVGAVIGTPWYMSPEQVQGMSAHVTHQADIFSVGVLVYELLTGRVPFCGVDRAQTFRDIAFSDPTPPRALRPDLSPALQEVVLRALRKKPEQRPPSMRQLVAQFVDAASAATPEQPVSTRLEQTVQLGGQDETQPAAGDLERRLLPGVVSGETAPEPGQAAVFGETTQISEPGPTPGASPGAAADTADRAPGAIVPRTTLRVRLPSRARLAAGGAVALLLIAATWLSWYVSRTPTATVPVGGAGVSTAGDSGGSVPGHHVAVSALPQADLGEVHAAADGAATTAADAGASRRRNAKPPAPDAGPRLSSAAARYGWLTVVTTHATKEVWADVFLDGRPIGRSVLYRKRIRAGRHKVEARRAGLGRVSKVIDLRPRQSLRLHLQLPAR